MKILTLLMIFTIHGSHGSFNAYWNGFIQWNFNPNLQSSSSLVQKTVGYLATTSKFGQAAPCYTVGSSIYGVGDKPVYIEGSTGYFSGSICWVKGITTAQEECYARGILRQGTARTPSEFACVIEEYFGFVIDQNYQQGVSSYAPPASNPNSRPVCFVGTTSPDYIQGNVLYQTGSSGLVYGSYCWVRGVMNSAGCDIPGTTGDLPERNGQACYISFASVYILGNNYAQLPDTWASYSGFSQNPGINIQITFNSQVTSSQNFTLRAVGTRFFNGKVEKSFCKLQSSSIEFGNPYIVRGSTGYISGANCWVLGVNDQGLGCSKDGKISTVYRNNLPLQSCNFQMVYAYEISGSWSVGSVTPDFSCSPDFTSENFYESIIYFKGSVGFVQGQSCWIRGMKNTQFCYYPGTTSRFNQVDYCFSYFNYAYDMTGYDIVNNFQELSWYRTSGFVSRSGFWSPTSCFINGRKDSEALDFVDESFGLVDGARCWVRGSTSQGGNDECFTEGSVQFLWRKSVRELTCVVESLMFGMRSGFVKGSAWPTTSESAGKTEVLKPSAVWKTVGYMKTQQGNVLTICYLQASNMEFGNPHYLDGSTGFYDGSTCWVKGTTDQGAECFKKGTIKTVSRRMIPQVSCSMTVTDSYDTENFAVGTSQLNDFTCKLSATSQYLEGELYYYRGATGIINGNSCWVRGNNDRGGCYSLGTTSTSGHSSCQFSYKLAYILANGYQLKKEEVPVQKIGNRFYKAVGFSMTATGSKKTSICYVRGQVTESAIEETSGAFDGATCWFKGVTGIATDETCWVTGAVKEQFCLMENVIIFSAKDYSVGSPKTGWKICGRKVMTETVRGSAFYEENSQGLIQGNDCWVQGVNDNQVCYNQGTRKGNSCSILLVTTFSMKNYGHMIVGVKETNVTFVGYVQKTLGYVRGNVRNVLVICLTTGSRTEPGSPVYVEGITGYFYNNNCWVKASTDMNHGEICYVPGKIKTFYRKNKPVVGCSKQDVIAVSGNFVEGSPGHLETQCNLEGEDRVQDGMIYRQGGQGFYRGSICWVKGTRDGSDCFVKGTKGNSTEVICYIMVDTAYMMAEGFENLNIGFSQDQVQEFSFFKEQSVVFSNVTGKTIVIETSNRTSQQGQKVPESEIVETIIESTNKTFNEIRTYNETKQSTVKIENKTVLPVNLPNFETNFEASSNDSSEFRGINGVTLQPRLNPGVSLPGPGGSRGFENAGVLGSRFQRNETWTRNKTSGVKIETNSTISGPEADWSEILSDRRPDLNGGGRGSKYDDYYYQYRDYGRYGPRYAPVSEDYNGHYDNGQDVRGDIRPEGQEYGGFGKGPGGSSDWRYDERYGRYYGSYYGPYDRLRPGPYDGPERRPYDGPRPTEPYNEPGSPRPFDGLYDGPRPTRPYDGPYNGQQRGLYDEQQRRPYGRSPGSWYFNQTTRESHNRISAESHENSTFQQYWGPLSNSNGPSGRWIYVDDTNFFPGNFTPGYRQYRGENKFLGYQGHFSGFRASGSSATGQSSGQVFRGPDLEERLVDENSQGHNEVNLEINKNYTETNFTSKNSEQES